MELSHTFVRQHMKVRSARAAMEELGCGRSSQSIEFDGGLFLFRAEKAVYPPIFLLSDYYTGREEKP